jgi:hypothetical protein
VRRWLVVALALLAAGAALFLLLSSPQPVPERSPDHTQIDSESRAKLRKVLREETGE